VPPYACCYFCGRFPRGKELTFVAAGSSPWLQQYWDSTALAAYSYNPAKKVFLSYDDERSLRAKARYVRQHRLDGILFWDLNLDTPGYRLLNLLYRALHSRT